jgi:hypothetical protein
MRSQQNGKNRLASADQGLARAKPAARNMLPSLPEGDHELLLPYNPGRGLLRKNAATRSEYKALGRLETLKKSWKYILLLLIWMYFLFSVGRISLPLEWACIALSYVFAFVKWIPYGLAPTNLQFGAQGLRLHWLYPYVGLISSPWICWDDVRYVAMAVDGHIDIELDRTKTSNGGKNVLLGLICGASQGVSRKTNSSKFRLRVEGLAHQTDVPPLLKVFRTYLGDRCDVSLAQWHAKQMGGSESFTRLWLDKLDDRHANSAVGSLQSGDVLLDGEYKILEQIGAGGQALIYRAERHTEGKSPEIVVLKEFFLPVRGGREIKERALKNVEHEASLLKSLSHGHIVKFIDAFACGSKAYLATELIGGRSLRSHVESSGPVTESQCVAMAIQVCDILEYLHGQVPPVVHRDMTPDNLMVDENGKIVIIDFNVAERLEADCTRSVVGKQSYISPEQFRGNPSIQSDIYSFGGVLFWLLTAEDPEPISMSHPRSLKPSLSESIDRIVARATTISADDRYKNANELRADLIAIKEELNVRI